MALDLNKMRAIQGAIGMPNPTEVRRREAVARVGVDFYRSLDVDKYLTFDQGITDTAVMLNIYDRKYSHYNGVEQKFTTLIDADIEAGDLVYCEKQDEWWVTMTSAPIDYIYRQGLMFLCDTTIKWEDEQGNIWEYPVSANNATQYNSGVYQGKMIDYVTNQFKLYTKADANICALRIDQRFFLGKGTSVPEVFRLTQVDTTALGYGRGVAMLTLLRATYNPETDDVETGICKFKEDIDDTPTEHSGDIDITFNGKPQLIIGDSKAITANVSSCTWSILEPDIAALVNIVNTSDNSAVMSLPFSGEAMAYAGYPFTVVCTGNNGEAGTRAFQILGGT